ncbi:MAG: TlpA disulfide reductase family protein [Bacteroidota bacterium]
MQEVNSADKPYVVINFFATWCKPCIQEIPELIALNNNPESEAKVLLVSIDEAAVFQDGLASFLDNLGVNFPSYNLSPDSLENFVSKVYPEWDTSIPLNFVYTNTGRLVEVTGMTDQTEISMIIHEDQNFNSL